MEHWIALGFGLLVKLNMYISIALRKCDGLFSHFLTFYGLKQDTEKASTGFLKIKNVHKMDEYIGSDLDTVPVFKMFVHVWQYTWEDYMSTASSDLSVLSTLYDYLSALFLRLSVQRP